MQRFNVVTRDYDTMVMVTIRNTDSANGINAIYDRLTELGVEGNVQYLDGSNLSNRYIWGYKVGNRVIRSIINGVSVASFAVMVNADSIPLEVVSSDSYEEDGVVYNIVEYESLNEKIIRGIAGASCSSFKTNGADEMVVEVGLV